MDESSVNATIYQQDPSEFWRANPVWAVEGQIFLAECKLARAEEELRNVVFTPGLDVYEASCGTTIPYGWGPNTEPPFVDRLQNAYSTVIETGPVCPHAQAFGAELDFSILDQSAFVSGTIVDLEALSVRSRVKELADTIEDVRQQLKQLERTIKLRLAINIFPRLTRQLIFRERAWCLLHGSHPPRKHTDLTNLWSLDSGGWPSRPIS
jgi:hypothetical protein